MSTTDKERQIQRGARIQALREAREWSKVDLAEILTRRGVPTDRLAVQRIESGRRDVRVDELVELAAIFRVSLAELAAGSAEADNSPEAAARLAAVRAADDMVRWEYDTAEIEEWEALVRLQIAEGEFRSARSTADRLLAELGDLSRRQSALLDRHWELKREAAATGWNLPDWEPTVAGAAIAVGEVYHYPELADVGRPAEPPSEAPAAE